MNRVGGSPAIFRPRPGRSRNRLAWLVPVLAIGGCSDPVQVAREISETEGAIDVLVLASGTDPDNAYRVKLDDRLERPVLTGARLTLTLVEPGVHAVLLQEIAPNCRVDGPNPRDVTVVAGARSTITFSVRCTSITGSVRVTTVTTGIDPDPDGYQILAERLGVTGPAPRIPTTGTTVVPAVPTGENVIALADVTPNCDPVGSSRPIVNVPSGDTASIAFDIVCRAVTRLAYAAPSGEGSDIYTVNANGTDRTRITNHPGNDDEPAWSPDGDRIAFSSERDGNREIYVMRADGSAPVRLTTDEGADRSPAWSPDGLRIAFIGVRDGVPDLYVMNAVGSGKVRLTSDSAADADPAWSPDGSIIAFTKHLPDGRAVYRIGLDGTEAVPVSGEAGEIWDPAWSPDGARLAVTWVSCNFYWCDDAIALVEADGSLFALPIYGNSPAWSPDGRNLSYAVNACDFYGYNCVPGGIVISRLNGTLPFTLTTEGSDSAWRQP